MQHGLNVSSKQHAIADKLIVRPPLAHPEVHNIPSTYNTRLLPMGRYSPKDANVWFLYLSIHLCEVLLALCKPWQHYVDTQHCRISPNSSLACQTVKIPA